jgi:hypothetical protein
MAGQGHVIILPLSTQFVDLGPCCVLLQFCIREFSPPPPTFPSKPLVSHFTGLFNTHSHHLSYPENYLSRSTQISRQSFCRYIVCRIMDNYPRPTIAINSECAAYVWVRAPLHSSLSLQAPGADISAQVVPSLCQTKISAHCMLGWRKWLDCQMPLIEAKSLLRSPRPPLFLRPKLTVSSLLFPSFSCLLQG